MRLLKLPIILILFVLIFLPASAQPVLPCTFWGSASINNAPAPIGTEILVYNANDKICGHYVIGEKSDDRAGSYGFLSCVGVSGDNFAAEFTINGNSANINGNAIWESGAIKRIDLSLIQTTGGSGSSGGSGAGGFGGDSSEEEIPKFKYIETDTETYFEKEGFEIKQIEDIQNIVKFNMNYVLLLLIILMLIIIVVYKKRSQKKRKS